MTGRLEGLCASLPRQAFRITVQSLSCCCVSACIYSYDSRTVVVGDSSLALLVSLARSVTSPNTAFVSAKCLMSTAQNYFRMKLGTLIVKRAYGKSHYVYKCADGLLKGQGIVTDAGAQRRVG